MTSERIFTKICLVFCLIALVKSQTVFIDVSTGRIFSLSHEIILSSFPDFVQQPQIDNSLKPRVGEETTPEWTCTNDKTRDTIILSTEDIPDRSPKTTSNDSLNLDSATKAPFPGLLSIFSTANNADAVSWMDYAQNTTTKVTRSTNENFGEDLIDIRVQKKN
ncbi:Protein of unknown function [Cotesia congregata]|uniref:Uncharacterized protein n=1 Tax=Cotesia congregata TaxID=51543 RepID=A0A8J2H9E9_COTCN|nr:Protein of unknown function [Cotesia congregata]